MGDVIDGRVVINSVFPHELRELLPPAFARAYSRIEELAGTVDFLQTEGGKQQLAHIRNSAVEFELIQLIREGKLPFTYGYQLTRQHTSKFFVMRSDDCIVTVSHVQEPPAFPRESHFRNRFRLANPPLLPFPNFWSDDEAVEKPYLILTHGHGALDFLRIGIPHPLQECWSAYIDILREREPAIRPEAKVVVPSSNEAMFDGAWPKLKSDVGKEKKSDAKGQT